MITVVYFIVMKPRVSNEAYAPKRIYYIDMLTRIHVYTLDCTQGSELRQIGALLGGKQL